MSRRPWIFHAAAGPILVTLLVSGCLALLLQLGWLETVELLGYDLLVARRGFAEPHPGIVIVDFNDASIAAIGRHPVPREVLAQVVEKIASGEPEWIGIDILLSERRDAAGDRRLTEVLANTDNVVLVDRFKTELIPAGKPLPEILQLNRPVGFVNLPLDTDGFIRRFYLYVKMPEHSGVSFAVELATNFLSQTIEQVGPQAYRLGSNWIPVEAKQHTVLIGAWNPTPASRLFPVQQLLQENFDTSVFQGKLVLVGDSSVDGKDLYATPLFRFRGARSGRAQLSGAEIHAAAISSLLTGQVVRPLPAAQSLGIYILLVALAGLYVVRLRPAYSVIAVLLVGAGAYVLAEFLFSTRLVWMRFVAIEAGIVLALTLGLAYRFLQERWGKAQAEEEKRRETEIRQKLENEMIMARQIQHGLLPASLPVMDGVEMAVRYEASLHVGGDYYDFLELSPGRVLFVVADVQGHGVSSALIMSNVQATLRAVVRLPEGETPEGIVAALNNAILESTKGQKLVTLFLGILDVNQRELQFVNAGHCYPLVFSAGGDTPQSLKEGGMLLGVIPGNTYDRGSIALRRGDVIIAYTDGITEAQDATGTEYTLPRLLEFLRPRLNRPAQELVDSVLQEATQFEHASTHQDDKIVLVMKIQ